MKIITENTSFADKEAIVRQAVTSGSVTLLTKCFGRGTDFVCFDEKLDASGGVHVIQTFISPDLSEVTQIQGRTARQGSRGSYSMVLDLEGLKVFSIDANAIKQMEQTGRIFSTIQERRLGVFEKTFGKLVEKMVDIKSYHEKTEEFRRGLQRGTGDREFILKENEVKLSCA